MFELKLNNGMILKSGSLAMCQAIQQRNKIENCSYILPMATKTAWKARLIIVSLAVITLILI